MSSECIRINRVAMLQSRHMCKRSSPIQPRADKYIRSTARCLVKHLTRIDQIAVVCSIHQQIEMTATEISKLAALCLHTTHPLIPITIPSYFFILLSCHTHINMQYAHIFNRATKANRDMDALIGKIVVFGCLELQVFPFQPCRPHPYPNHSSYTI